ncbi:unnamed protein product, partial [Hymenolepis diminuta]
VEFTKLRRLIKGISRGLKHSGNCHRTIERIANKCGVRARILPVNHRSVILQRSVDYI